MANIKKTTTYVNLHSLKKELRNHQLEAIEKVLPYMKRSTGKVLISMPQGTGESAVIVNLFLKYLNSQANIYDEKILIIVDRKSILEQLKRLFQEVFDDSKIITEGLISDNKNTPFLINTLQSLIKNEKYKDLGEFFDGKIVFFNCESLGVGKANSPIQNLIQYFKYTFNIGIDGMVEKSTRYFGVPVFEYSLEEAIADRILVDYKVTYIQLNREEPEYWASVNDITELDEAALDYFYGNLETFETLSKSILEITKGEKTVIFCKSIEYAQRLTGVISELTNNNNICKTLTSDTPSNEAQQHLLDFRNGEVLNILVNVNLLSTGVDLPNVKQIVFLKDFGSNAQLYQILASYARPYDNKEVLHVIDYVGIKALSNTSNPKEEELTIEAEKNTNKEKLDVGSISKADIIFKDGNSLEGVIGVKDLAEECSQLISKMPYEQGRMIGIFGKWGRGKTFLFEETWKLLEKEENIKRIDFHAWKYQDTPAIWAYLYERFATEYYETTPNKWSRFWRRIKLNQVRLGSWIFLWFIISLIISSFIAFGIPLSEKINLFSKIIGSLSLSVVISLIIIYFKFKNSARELFKKYYSKKSFTHVLGIQAEVQKELKSLIEAWSKYIKKIKIVLFVDDIDRCSEDKIISIVDSLRVMLDDEVISSNLVVVTAIDERILKRAVSVKYQELVGTNSQSKNSSIKPTELASEYLDKLFITGIKLGKLIPEEKDEFFIELTKNDRETENLKPFNELLSIKEDLLDIDEFDSTNEENWDIAIKDGDFVVKDGDFALENDKGEVKSSAEIIRGKFLKENQAALSRIEKLTDKEINLLREKLHILEDVTPRQIRIFYYRYLIARNLLIRQYSKLERKNIWILNLLSEFIEILILLSKKEAKHSISQERKKILNSTETNYKIEFLDNKVVHKNDYLLLICTLDTVIGY